MGRRIINECISILIVSVVLAVVPNNSNCNTFRHLLQTENGTSSNVIGLLTVTPNITLSDNGTPNVFLKITRPGLLGTEEVNGGLSADGMVVNVILDGTLIGFGMLDIKGALYRNGTTIGSVNSTSKVFGTLILSKTLSKNDSVVKFFLDGTPLGVGMLDTKGTLGRNGTVIGSSNGTITHVGMMDANGTFGGNDTVIGFLNGTIIGVGTLDGNGTLSRNGTVHIFLYDTVTGVSALTTKLNGSPNGTSDGSVSYTVYSLVPIVTRV